MVAVEVIRDEVIQEMFGLAFFTQRDREVAIEVVVDTLVRMPLVRDVQDECPKAKKMQPYKLRIPEDLLVSIWLQTFGNETKGKRKRSGRAVEGEHCFDRRDVDRRSQ
jgi:hypothetical protein